MQNFIVHHGYLALALLALIQACCVPIPSEVTLGFAGVLAGEGKLNLAVVVLIGTLAEVVGSGIAYAIGRTGGRPFVERFGRYALITSADLDRAEQFFSGRGGFAVIFGRTIPFLRALVSVVAGIAEMPPIRFIFCSAAGTFIYATTLSSMGYGVGSNWQRISHDFFLIGYGIVALIVMVIAVFLITRVRSLRTERS